MLFEIINVMKVFLTGQCDPISGELRRSAQLGVECAHCVIPHDAEDCADGHVLGRPQDEEERRPQLDVDLIQVCLANR